jgi:Zinc dependent phospholipase C
VHPSPKPARLFWRSLLRLVVLLCLLVSSQSSPAYSVLTHEQIVDMLWHDQIRPILLARYPTATDADLREAHAYAYGGCLIQDIGYYPFGSHLFSDLTHYVRSGDFVLALLNQAQSLDEYAFALGALAHYASDTAGHPAVNQSVALDFPKLRQKYGPTVTYEDNPKAHIRTEFGFDVVQVARDRFTSDAYHDFIGFEVSRPVLERAFLVTYGLKLTDVISNPDLSIGSFRYTVSALIPQLTKVAIVTKRDEILQEDPTMTRKRFLYHLSRSDFEHDWGKDYKRPGFVAHFLAFLVRILPHIGPLSTLDIKVPSKATETLYMKSVDSSADSYGRDLKLAVSNTLVLQNEDFDTGLPTKAGEYRLTDETYAQLLDKLTNDHFAQITPELRANLLDYYSAPQPSAFATKSPKKWAQAMKNLALLKASPPAAPATPPAASSR